MSEADEIEFLRQWADANRGRLELEGHIGFGRDCVGILVSTELDREEYPSYEEYLHVDVKPYLMTVHECPTAAPPEGVPDAYHKHACLAVLGRGPGATHQLYLWVKELEARGITVEVGPRLGRAIDLVFHGPNWALLVQKPVPSGPPEAPWTPAD